MWRRKRGGGREDELVRGEKYKQERSKIGFKESRIRKRGCRERRMRKQGWRGERK